MIFNLEAPGKMKTFLSVVVGKFLIENLIAVELVLHNPSLETIPRSVNEASPDVEPRVVVEPVKNAVWDSSCAVIDGLHAVTFAVQFKGIESAHEDN